MPTEKLPAGAERRRKPRYPASGLVTLWPEGLASAPVAGQILDISGTGFRAAHGFQSLVAGHIVAFAHGNISGHARVAWTRITGQQVQSGFIILGAD